ncbi:hypothetical protein [Mycobacterium persicum]|uniref:Transmembrane protein n=1 Tax=Mycobacterium persicum TaxID=1487726 RepID=A0AB38UL91_9MYCO|nr:hypothetical protein [Mycobacterium persicum]ORB90280.1 hypothetical protein B1T49_14795 [Mycobacterium persicum]ORC02462.1 hypothetical protein B1T48_15520 [Mycobacterium persicum]VAZ81352.1 hypothetical protein LAUMK42_00153 [Mycobacterium persicum]
MPATLSQIRAWSIEHLIDAAGYWTKTADQWEDTFLQMRNQSYAIAWHGAGGDGLRQRTSADLPIVSAKAELLRQAAGIARDGASEIGAAQRRVLYAVEDAQNAGFTVGEDLSVTDAHTSRTAAEQAARQAQAQAFAGNIRLRAEQLDGAEAKVAGQLTATTAGLSGVSFAENPISTPVPQAPATQRNGIRLVDFKQDGGTSPPPPFAPWDTPDGTPTPPQPAFFPQYEQAITAPPAPAQPGPPMPATPPPPPLPATGPGGAAAAKPRCSPYDATKALLEPAGGMIAILTAVPEGGTGVGIPAAVGQIALGTAAVADGLDAAGKCLD